MYEATVKQMLCKVNHENLGGKIKGESKRALRFCLSSPAEADVDNTSEANSNVEANIIQKLLFPHQGALQRHLLNRYGNEIMLLDATYKTIRYKLPLFFLVVKTNVNYTVVESFITKNETTASIEKPPKIFHDGNHKWKPPVLHNRPLSRGNQCHRVHI